MERGNGAATTPLLVNGANGVGEEKRLTTTQEFAKESRFLWKIAGPAIFTAISQYSLGALTQTFAGFVGEIELAAVSVENSVIAGLAFGVMLGMGSALETLCGQAYGAGKIRMLGVYMQRSWVILLTTACLLTPIYIWSPPILEVIGETTQISKAAGKFAIWMLPQLFAYALNFPIQKFLQAQRKVMVMAWISAVVLVFHAFFSWLFILKLGWGLVGAAVMLNLSWWLIVISQLAYIFITTSDGAWSGFSMLAFADLWGFIKLSLASAVMLCLEFWYLMILVVIVGRLPNPLIPVDAISICMNIQGWDAMIALGFNAAISVRVSNELGAGNFRQAKIAVMVVSSTTIVIGVACSAVIFATRSWFPYLFTSSDDVAEETTKLAILLGITVLLNSLQPVLSGVAVGAGWQAVVAYINIGCYYVVGLPAGILLGFVFDFGAAGIWGGMIGGICLQTLILIVITSLTNWSKEASEAENRALLEKFVKNHGKGLPTHAYLNVPNGAKWPVKLVEEEGIVWFQNGWDDFVAHYSIAIGHFLVFRYESADSDFHVLIFDHSATEVDYGVVGDSGERGIGHGSGSCTSDAGPKSQDASQVGKNKESGGDTVGPNTTTVAAAEAEEDRETSDDDDLSIEILDHAGDDGGLEFNSNGDDEEKTEASVRTCRQRAVGRAEAFQRKCKNPSFMLTIVPCCLTKPYVMHIPNHARKYFPENGKGSHRIIILGRNRKKWLVKYHVGSTRAFNFTGGWKSFTMDNHLRVGHVCVFEFMNHKKLQVTIFR